MNLAAMTDAQYGLLFAVRRSMRYHEARRAFFDGLHRVTAGLTVLLAGSVLFDLARPGETAGWLLALAAVLSAWDVVVGYAAAGARHQALKTRFGALEMALLDGAADDATWASHQRARLVIEQDEPPVYRMLDTVCHNDVMIAEGFSAGSSHYVSVSPWQRATRHLFHWSAAA